MMTLPTSRQLLDVIRGELAALPAEHAETVALIDGLLGTVAERAEHEIAWAIEEIDAIDALAGALFSRTVGRPEAFDLASVRARYHEASALLAECVEPAMDAGGVVREQLDAIVAMRTEHERQIRGDLSLVGRG